MYQVWVSQGQGGFPCEEFATLDEALAYVQANEGRASFGIKYPDGTWHDWGHNRPAMSPDLLGLIVEQASGHPEWRPDPTIESLQPDTVLLDILDSLDAVSLFILIEERFGIEFTDEEYETTKTVVALDTLVKAKRKELADGGNG